MDERTVDVHVRKLCVALVGTSCDDLIQIAHGSGYRPVAGTGDTTTAHTAGAIGMQLEVATRKAELSACRRVPATCSLDPAQLGAWRVSAPESTTACASRGGDFLLR